MADRSIPGGAAMSDFRQAVRTPNGEVEEIDRFLERLLCSAIDSQLLELRQPLEFRRRQYDELTGTLPESAEGLDRLTREYREVADALADDVAKATEVYDEIRAIPGVLDVRPDGSALLLYTEEIVVEHPETNCKHLLGAFEIELELGFGNRPRGFRFTNLTGFLTRDDRIEIAPHIDRNGKPRWTTLDESFLAQRNLVAAARIAVEFLTTIPPEAREVLNLWPKLNKEEQ